ncbi:MULTISPECIES: alpha/beta hydrolase [unclassified Ruegeria]|uniref:PHA/PHB synthase family protein n=1 Tax=unclassified Ruegeria TaxID=2625375 RepID=UPI0014898F66|nr:MULTISPECIES: class I poly(R)-hydroxyalkanoic acid synthase [unclassified Ruegeria]NOD77417.1 class I poly(R)-hydroxyalkanoic acid synthase [Ruegeria sp. HKCCD4332]NOD87840.1 class I poly(R)-hydroxyalkanoic acid synthase [Ruegeria sp. HKCCD4318]NOE14210.1 class I poly(R)-hydroxyalkanoic acid synthase [Ruegeria sp. HKCCD4318-2]NOG08433.1 class I poly(R)-hydroxyalkanoic acid synthase [Ruegeria sp. HKCCD4315]
MTTSEDQMPDVSDEHIERLKENMDKVEQLSKRLIEVMATKKPHTPALDGPNQELFARAATAYWAEAWQNPAKLLEQQIEFWGKSVLNFAEAQQALTQGEVEDENPAPGDKRFSNPLWETNPYFRLIRQQYQTNAQAIAQAVASVDDLDAKDKQRLQYFSQQIIDMMAPTNFLATNPDALQKAVETEGQSLIQGLENLVSDLEANDGELVVKLADENAFEVGGNLATTPGDVVFRNRMMELIQYKPATESVYETPIVLFPPWINKFYILDLKAQNSLIKWITDQGYTLFVVSWVNPDESYAETGMEDYIQDGFLTAIDVAKKICKVKQVNAVGYCIAGTTLSLTLSLLKQRGDKSVKSATLFTALTDFSDQGEFTPFLQNDFIDGIEEEVNKEGVLRSWIMARTMSFLRSRDLVYGPAIRSYMMGEVPPAFDLLYWNGDGANLPAKMAVQYLRGLCQRNEFATNGFELMGHKLTLNDVDVPLMAITCETDHIAAWKDCYRGVQKMGSRSKTFVVSESGHIAGIVNPPSKKKYGHYTNPDLKADSDTWLKEADFHQGSWWPMWDAWLKKRSGKQVPARDAGDSDHPSLAPAPGTYVLANPNA